MPIGYRYVRFARHCGKIHIHNQFWFCQLLLISCMVEHTGSRFDLLISEGWHEN